MVPGEIPGVKIVDFNLSNAILNNKGKSMDEAVVPKYLKTWTFDTEITTMVALHYEKANGSLFLLCEAAYYVFTRKNAYSDY